MHDIDAFAFAFASIDMPHEMQQLAAIGGGVALDEPEVLEYLEQDREQATGSGMRATPRARLARAPGQKSRSLASAR